MKNKDKTGNENGKAGSHKRLSNRAMVLTAFFLLGFSGAGFSLAKAGGLYALEQGNTSETENGEATPSSANPSTAIPSAASQSTASPSDADGEGTGTSVMQRMILRAAGVSSDVSDVIVDSSEMEQYVHDISVSVEKLTSGNYVFTVTAKEKGPYRENSTNYHYYWGPFLAFTLNGKTASPGVIAPTTKSGDAAEYYLMPDEYHYYKIGTSSYKTRRFLNQSEWIVPQNNSVQAGNALSAYSTATHTSVDDSCTAEKITIGTIVSYSDSTPSEDKDGSAEYDIAIRLELSGLSDAVTGFYVGSYEYGYYSGDDTDAKANYRVSESVMDASAALSSARKGKVTISFLPGAGSGGPGTVELIPGVSYSPSSPAPPTGYRFSSWSGWSGTVPSEDTSYSAVYQENLYHLHFDTQGGSAVSDLSGIPYTSSAYCFPATAKKGYRLTGWRYQG